MSFNSENRKVRAFTLSANFMAQFQGKQPRWGFGGLGLFTYKRSYALKKPDGTQEEFFETCQRVVEGVYNLQKRHCRANGLAWNEPKAQRSAQEMYRRMWGFKWSPPGRGLDKMGTDAVYKKGGAMLNSCAFTSTERIGEDFAAPFTFLMDMSMLGVGVGGDTKGAGKATLRKPKMADKPFVVEDSREGWVALAKTVLNSFVGRSLYPETIDVTLVRERGAPLKTFGGTSSGPGPLVNMIKGITRLLLPTGVTVQFEESRHPNRENEPGYLRTYLSGKGSPYRISSTQIVDVFNYIGKCVVAGGIRRTAEIMFGEPTDREFLDLKDTSALAPLYTERQTLKSIEGIWPPEVQARLAEIEQEISAHPANDRRWACVTGDTWVDTAEGSRPIRELVGRTDVQVLLNGQVYPALGVKQTGHEPVFTVQTRGGPMLRATSNHPLMTKRGWVPVGELRPGEDQILVSDNKPWIVEIDHTGSSYRQGYLLGALIGDGTFTSTSTMGSDIARLLTYVGDDGEASLRDFMTSIFDFPTRSDFNGFSGPHGKDSSAYYFLSCKAFTEMAASYGVKRGQKTLTPEVEKASLPFIAGVVGGLFDADGYVIPARKTLGIDTMDKALLISLQRMLLRLGIVSRVHQVRECQEKVIAGGRVTHTREVYRLVLSGYGEASRMVALCGLHHSKKLDRWLAVAPPPNVKKQHTFLVDSVVPGGYEDVFDICVPGPDAFAANGLFVHNSNNTVVATVGMDYADIATRIANNGEPGLFWLKNAQDYGRMGDAPDYSDAKSMGCNPCSEQTLEDKEACTLVETYPAHHDNYEDYQRTLKFAYLYAKTVTLVPTHDPRTNAVMNRNRRIGCSMSGIRQAITKFGRREFLTWCDQGYRYIRKLDKVYSDWLGIPLSIKVTSVKPSGCRPWYALTSTNKGLLTLEDLFEHHPVDQEWAKQPDHDLEAIGTGIISKTYNNGVSQVLRITTSYGIEVESTPNHQWWVKQTYKRGLREPYQEVNAWRRADEIQPGDILDIQPGIYNMEGGEALAPLNSLALNMRGDATEIQQPSEMNPRLAWLLGYLWGDGAMSPGKYRLRWVDARRENLLKAQAVLKEQFGLTAEIKQASEHRQAETLEIGSKHLWHWLIRNDVFKLYADKIDIIPKVVRASGQEDIIAFLAGLLDSDGWAGMTEQGAKLVWTTADGFFAKHVQDVALAVGLVLGRSHVTGGSSFQNHRSMYHLTQSAHVDPRAFEMLRRHSTKVAGVEARADFSGWHCLRGDEMTCGKLILGKVLKVEPVGEMPTYDVEVYGDFHWYFAGAIKSHNTVSLLCGATPGVHLPHSEYYIRNIRVHGTSPFVQAAMRAGYPVELDQAVPDTWVVSFPVKEENFAKGKNDTTIWEQMALAADLQRYWADNQVSVTVTFKKHEAKEIQTCLEVFEDRLKAVSMLPLNDHGYVQAPYIEIDKATYDAMVANITPMDMSGKKREVQDLFCDGDRCTLSFT